jgi:DNA-binding GntR family transcriptional regulator
MKKEIAYQDLKQRILKEELTPGQWLVERNICRDYEISRTPVREILRMLVTDGIVTLEPSKGYLVRKLNLEEIVEIFQVREAIEGTAARLSCIKGDESFFSQMAELMEKFENLDIEEDSSLGVVTGNELHDAIIEAANNKLLSEFYQKLRNLLTLIRNITKKSVEIEMNSRNGHLAITRAVQQRNEIKSEQCMREHLSTTCRSLVQSYLINQTGFIDNQIIWDQQTFDGKSQF